MPRAALHVDSPDGTLEAAFVLIDTLGTIRAPVRAICRGEVGTTAIGVVAAADDRTARPHARFRLAQPGVRFSGSPDQVDAQTHQHVDLLVRFQAHLARATGRPVDEIAADMRRDRRFDAEEARGYGLTSGDVLQAEEREGVGSAVTGALRRRGKEAVVVGQGGAG